MFASSYGFSNLALRGDCKIKTNYNISSKRLLKVGIGPLKKKNLLLVTFFSKIQCGMRFFKKKKSDGKFKTNNI